MNNGRQKCEGLGYFNLARGIGMVLVLAGHSWNPILPVSDEFRLFDGAGSVFGGGVMAMFFLISGFGFYRRSPRKCWSIQTKLLLRPYCLVAAAVLGTKLFLALVEQRSFWKHGGELVFTYLLGLNAEGGGSLFGIPVESVSIFWFVLALFGGWNLYNRIAQLKSPCVRGVLAAGCAAAGYFLTLISKVWPFCLPMSLIAAGYLAAGAAIRKYRLLEKKLPIWCWMILLLPVIVSSAFGQVNIVSCVWRLGLIDVAATFCTGYLLLRFYVWFMERERHGRIVSLLEKVGFYSIWVVSLHAYEKMIFPWYRLYLMFPKQPWIGAVLCFVCRSAMIYLLFRVCAYLGLRWKRKCRRKKLNVNRRRDGID